MFPAVTRDLNLVVDESVRWADVAATVRSGGRALRRSRSSFRTSIATAERLGAGKKSLLFTLTLRSREGTLTNDEADQIRRAWSRLARGPAAQLRA